MLRTHWRRLAVIALGVLTVALPGAPSAAWSNVALERDDLARLVAALLGPTPLLGDLAALSDQIGHTRAEIDQLVRSTNLGQQMQSFGLLEAWTLGQRGRGFEVMHVR